MEVVLGHMPTLAATPWLHTPAGRITVGQKGAPAAWHCCQWLRGLGAGSGGFGAALMELLRS